MLTELERTRTSPPTARPVPAWPQLPHEDWADTLEVVHLWSQVVGKVRLVQSPWINHGWNVTLYVSPDGLRTSLVPHGSEGFELAFDLHEHSLRLTTTTGIRRSLQLGPGSVADFYAGVLDLLAGADMAVTIDPRPNEIPDAVPFDRDTAHRTYEPAHAEALWRALVQAERVLTRFRAGYQGKASPVHLFWGSFDLATTRFSGRTAPPHPGGVPAFPDDLAREAYSAELTSAGFWPGNRQMPEPVFYAYAYPAPDGFDRAVTEPVEASWHDGLGEYVVPYAAVAGADDPDQLLLRFLEATHGAAADLARWDRTALECGEGYGPDWWRNRR